MGGVGACGGGGGGGASMVAWLVDAWFFGRLVKDRVSNFFYRGP